MPLANLNRTDSMTLRQTQRYTSSVTRNIANFSDAITMTNKFAGNEEPRNSLVNRLRGKSEEDIKIHLGVRKGDMTFNLRVASFHQVIDHLAKTPSKKEREAKKLEEKAEKDRLRTLAALEKVMNPNRLRAAHLGINRMKGD